jgi:ABC-2 type transport system ATP-binding protein
VAIDHVSFEIAKGEILGILGQNGAGKTTLLEMLEGIHTPTSGTIQVQGFFSIYDNLYYKKTIGVQLQNASIQENMTVYEICKLFSLFHQLPPHTGLSLLEEFAMADKQNRLYRHLSGGEACLLQIVLAFLHRPQIVFLDEPTTGLDPIARRRFWDFVKSNKNPGQTILVTTHYVEEVQELCDHVLILSQGRILKLDTPQNLIESSSYRHKIVLSGEKANLPMMAGVTGIKSTASATTLYTKDYMASLKDLLQYIECEKISIHSIALEKSKLEDVYVELLGSPDTRET